jgi:hypothetical protein
LGSAIKSLSPIPMRKRIIVSSPTSIAVEDRVWLDLEKLAEVEITSETPANPVDFALVAGTNSGWTASQSGEQTLRLLFDQPQKLKHIRLVFIENIQGRTQEFVLRWSADGMAFHDIVRQQYNFNPPSTEVEEYDVNLDGVTTLELRIIPDMGGGPAIASLAELRVA